MARKSYDREMALFTDDEIHDGNADWQILRDGGISLYLRPAVLEAELEWLRSRDYELKELDSGLWLTEALMHDALASALCFPAYYGRNLDALNECLTEDVAVPTIGGLVLVLKRFHLFAEVSSLARAVLDICARASRSYMLSGRRFMVLVHSDDPLSRFDGLGCVDAGWNRKEWLLKNRGL